MGRIYVFVGLMLAQPLFAAVEAIVVNGSLGHVALVGQPAAYENALGFGFEAGVKANSLLDVQFGLRQSSHSVGLSILNPTLSAEFHVSQFYDVDMIVGCGPGFYQFSANNTSRTHFGVQFGGAVDVVVEDSLRFGVGVRYHSVFDASENAPSHWAVLMRVGYTFGLSR